MGSTKIFHFLAIYRYLQASTCLIDAFSATMRSFWSPSSSILTPTTRFLPVSSPHHQANNESSSYCSHYSSNSISSGSSFSLPPQNACMKVRAFSFFLFSFFSILLLNFIYSWNACTFVRPFSCLFSFFLNFIVIHCQHAHTFVRLFSFFFFFLFLLLHLSHCQIPFYICFVFFFLVFFLLFFFVILFTPETQVPLYVHLFIYFILFFAVGASNKQCDVLSWETSAIFGIVSVGERKGIYRYGWNWAQAMCQSFGLGCVSHLG